MALAIGLTRILAVSDETGWRAFSGRANSQSRISGDTSAGVLNRLDEVVARHPKIVFLIIGSNDLQMGVPVPAITANIRLIVGAL